MSFQKSVVLCLSAGALLFAMVGSPAAAQSAKKQTRSASASMPEGGTPRYIQPETPEQRQKRLGTTEDPGPNPDPKTVFERNGEKFSIERFEKRYAKYVEQPGWIKPFAQVNIAREIYQENDKYVWVWTPIRTDEEELARIPEEERWAGGFYPYSKEDIAYFRKLRGEFEVLTPQASNVSVRFEESSKGLPDDGSWRNGAATADMNKDGILDLILPPQRGAAGAPAIFLGSANGEWTRWKIQWPRAINYGTVAVADFNRDAHLDLAFGVHLSGVAIFLGNGKGGFTEIVEGLAKNFPTRRVVATDVDKDGWSDVVAISEGPVGRAEDGGSRFQGTLRVYLNRNKARQWEEQNIAEPREFTGGDFLTELDFNGDEYPDFIGSNVYFNATHTLFISEGKGKWDSFGLRGLNVPGRSYYWGTAAGKFVKNARTDDAIQTYTRTWPTNLDPTLVPVPAAQRITGIDRISMVGGEPKRTSIMRWEGIRGIRAIETADFDGDGNLDILFGDERERTMELLLGDGNGGFTRGSVSGLPLLPQRVYDVLVADFNEDRRPDVMLMYESDERSAFERKNGGVHVYLNRGKAAADAAGE